MRHHGKLDANQHAIVHALRAIGLSVLSLANLGQGAPDIAVGGDGRTFLYEIKDGSLPPSKKRLTEDEQAFHANWRGHLRTVETFEEICNDIAIPKEILLK